MHLELLRHTFTALSTCGTLSIDGKFFCDTLEDADRHLERVDSKKVNKQTAIPRGKYPIAITFSNRFQKYMIQIMNVPGFEGIRIHGGRNHNDTEGCPLVGNYVDDHTITDGIHTSNRLFDLVEAAIKRGETVTIEVA
jgi:hypothetical protein